MTPRRTMVVPRSPAPVVSPLSHSLTHPRTSCKSCATPISNGGPGLTPGLQTAVLAETPRSRAHMWCGGVRAGHDESTAFPSGDAIILVLKGTWWVGAGPKWDRDATTPVSAGSLVVHHPNKIHYDGAKDEEVVLQIVSVGPSATSPVDESGQTKK